MFSFERFMGIGEASSFSVQLRCFSPPFFQRYDTQKINELTYGGKILLPTSCLDTLVRRNIQWPMLFKLTNVNPEHQKSTHAGVLEFLAEEGRCYLPSWMMNQLSLMEGDLILVEYRSLPAATYAKFKPMSTDFYHVTNPKAMLEVELRKFACLTKGDVIAVQYNDQVFEFKVMSLKPKNAVTIIECDINIEFDAAEGYVEPEKPKENKVENQKAKEGLIKGDLTALAPEEAKNVWKPFAGSGYRLDGKSSSKSNAVIDRKSVNRFTKQSEEIAQSAPSSSKQSIESINPIQNVLSATPIIVDENYAPGGLTFVRTEDYKSRAVLEKLAREQNENFDEELKPFSGKGHTIR